MANENRKEERFPDIGRVDAIDICSLPGVLDDISLSGCKVHFPVPVTVDEENDYEIKIRPASKCTQEPLVLICHPQWNKIKENNESQIGFAILRSPDTPQLTAYIEERKANNEDDSAIVDSMIIKPTSSLI